MKSKVKTTAFLLMLFTGVFFTEMVSAEPLYTARGISSWYGPGFHGKLTASGERFDSNDLTAAHKTLPFGTMLKVTNRDNGKSVVVRVNDRGPFVPGRIIDVSRGAAVKLGMIETGTAPVLIEELPGPAREPKLFSVQAASYSVRENAERLIRDLADSGLTAEIVRAGEYYRVIFTDVSEEELPDVVEGLKRMGIRNPLIR